jgi:hypothetical protein
MIMVICSKKVLYRMMVICSKKVLYRIIVICSKKVLSMSNFLRLVLVRFYERASLNVRFSA